MLLVAGFASVAHAQDARPDRGIFENRKMELREAKERLQAEMKQRRETMKSEFREFGEERKEVRHASTTPGNKGQERRTEVLERNAAKMVEKTAERLSATVARLEKIMGRVESRITKIGSTGASTTDATNFVNAAKTSLQEAKSGISGLGSVDTSLGTSSATSTPANFQRVRAAVGAVKEDLKAAHENLVKAIRSLASIEKPEDNSSQD